MELLHSGAVLLNITEFSILRIKLVKPGPISVLKFQQMATQGARVQFYTWIDLSITDLFIAHVSTCSTIICITTNYIIRITSSTSHSAIYQCRCRNSIKGAIMLNPIERFKRSILHLNRSLHHWSVMTWWDDCLFGISKEKVGEPYHVTYLFSLTEKISDSYYRIHSRTSCQRNILKKVNTGRYPVISCLLSVCFDDTMHGRYASCLSCITDQNKEDKRHGMMG